METVSNFTSDKNMMLCIKIASKMEIESRRRRSSVFSPTENLKIATPHKWQSRRAAARIAPRETALQDSSRPSLE